MSIDSRKALYKAYLELSTVYTIVSQDLTPFLGRSDLDGLTKAQIRDALAILQEDLLDVLEESSQRLGYSKSTSVLSGDSAAFEEITLTPVAKREF
jgi:hypothetical protein